MNWLGKISEFWPHLAVAFHLLASFPASAHALLHKRDSRAATLWIAFIWLMPAVGSLLYLVLGINRNAVLLATHYLSPEQGGRPMGEVSACVAPYAVACGNDQPAQSPQDPGDGRPYGVYRRDEHPARQCLVRGSSQPSSGSALSN